MLKDGRRLPCDIFVVAAGIVPNTALAQAAGLDCKRGVLVDQAMRTSDPLIFAAGDLAEHAGQIYGLWPTAVEQAEVAATNTVGASSNYTGTIPVTILKVVGVDVTSVGQFEAERPRRSGDRAGRSGRRTLSKTGDRQMARSSARSCWAIHRMPQPVTAAIKQGRDVRGLVPELQAGNWAILAAPSQPTISTHVA